MGPSDLHAASVDTKMRDGRVLRNLFAVGVSPTGSSHKGAPLPFPLLALASVGRDRNVHHPIGMHVHVVIDEMKNVAHARAGSRQFVGRPVHDGMIDLL